MIIKNTTRLVARLAMPAAMPARMPAVTSAAAMVLSLSAIAPSVAMAQISSDDAVAAEGQITAAKSRWVVVTSDATPVRSGPMDRFYPTFEVDRNRPLQVIGDENGWLSVRLPAGTKAFVKANDAELEGESSVRLTRPSRLRAAHLTGGLAASWRSLLAEPLPAGTELGLLDTITDGSRTTGFAVLAPAGATGFIAKSQTRAIEGDELARLQQTTPAGVLPTTSPTTLPAQPISPAANAPAEPKTEDQSQSDQGTALEVDTTLLTPMASPDSPPTETAAAEETATTGNADTETASDAAADSDAQPAETNAATGSDQAAEAGTRPLITAPQAQEILRRREARNADQPSATDDAPQADRPSAPEQAAPRQALTLDELDAAYERMKALPVEEAELAELRAEYQRAIDQTPSDAFNERLLQQLRNRLAFIDARIRVKELKLTRARESEVIPQDLIALRSRIATIKASGRFDVVGELTPSTLYDGGRLPRLIAVRSRDGYGRTIGYLSPTPDVLARLGDIVGIEGSTALDEELGVMLVTPRRIEAFRRD